MLVIRRIRSPHRSASCGKWSTVRAAGRRWAAARQTRSGEWARFLGRNSLYPADIRSSVGDRRRGPGTGRERGGKNENVGRQRKLKTTGSCFEVDRSVSSASAAITKVGSFPPPGTFRGEQANPLCSGWILAGSTSPFRCADQANPFVIGDLDKPI